MSRINMKTKVVAGKAGIAATLVEKMDHVRRNFDGLGDAVEQLPEGKQKTNVSRWLGDAYLASAKTIFELSAGKYASITP